MSEVKWVQLIAISSILSCPAIYSYAKYCVHTCFYYTIV